MRYLFILLILCVLTMTPADHIGQDLIPNSELPQWADNSALSKFAILTIDFHQISRNLLLFFLLLLSTLCLGLIRELAILSEAKGAIFLKRNLEKDLSAKTIQGLQDKLAEKEKQLARLTLEMEEKRHVLKKIRSQLNDWYLIADGSIKNKLRTFRYTIDHSLNRQMGWLPFQKQLAQVHPGFISRLQKEFPNLNVNDLRLCSYLRMNLSTQEIASLTHIRQSSVQKARYRLKKKLALPAYQDLHEFIITI